MSLNSPLLGPTSSSTLKGKHRRLSRCSGQRKVLSMLQGKYSEYRIPKFLRRNEFLGECKSSKSMGKLILISSMAESTFE